VVQAQKKIALLHRYPANQIKETNAAFPYLKGKGIDVLTFRKFDKLNHRKKFWKSIAWIFYAPLLVLGKGYDVIYCDDSYPFYPALVKLASPKSKVVLRIGDFHLMYYYSGLVYRILHFFEKITWKIADEILAISEEMRCRIEYEIGKKVMTVLDPVEERDFLSANTLKTKEKIVMFHGLLNRNKNIDVLLAAARRMPEISFWIVGDGPDCARLKNIAPKNVSFKGWQPYSHMYSFINNCDIGIALRSDNPGNDFVVTSPFLQYGVMGKPCLVTRRRVFGAYEWQFSNVDQLIEKIKIIFQKPGEGEKLRRYILKHHRAEDVAEKIWSLLLS